jgi:hypothetical protein
MKTEHNLYLELESLKKRIAALEAEKVEEKQHPVQPLYKDSQGVIRFKPNQIVEYLLDNGPFDLNQLAYMKFSQEDEEQFAQLIGYSLCGFGDLGYVSDETYERAANQLEENRNE